MISFVFRIFALEDEEDTDRFNRGVVQNSLQSRRALLSVFSLSYYPLSRGVQYEGKMLRRSFGNIVAKIQISEKHAVLFGGDFRTIVVIINIFNLSSQLKSLVLSGLTMPLSPRKVAPFWQKG